MVLALMFGLGFLTGLDVHQEFASMEGGRVSFLVAIRLRIRAATFQERFQLNPLACRRQPPSNYQKTD